MKIINSFRGNFEFLSNFSPHSFIDKDGVEWKTSEHFYQALKTNDKEMKEKILEYFTPG